MTIGEKIKQIRKEKGLTQKELGKISCTSEGTIRQYEIGKRQPRLEPLRQIAKALGVTVSVFIEDTPDFWENLPEDDKNSGFEPFAPEFSRSRIDRALNQLNAQGLQKAAENVEIIAGNPRFKNEPSGQ